MPPRILICRATPIAPDPRVEKIARSLVAGGYPVLVLGWDMTGQLPVEEILNQNQPGAVYRRIRLRVKASFGHGLRNIIHQLRWQTALTGWLFRHRQEYDIIHACDFDTVLPALLVRSLWHKKVVYDIFDFYADMLRATPNPVKKLIRWVDIRAINRADAVILADDSRTEQIAGSTPQRIEIIYNCLEDERLRLNGLSLSRPAGSQLHIAYVGNLQIERGLLVLLDILHRHPEWTLDLAGFGGDEKQILGAASFSGVTWHGRVPYERALQLNASADVLIATYDPAIPNNRYSSPNKVFEAMMLGKPIIVARGTNMDRIIEEAGNGLVINYGDTAALETALARLQNDAGLRRQLGDNARRAFETKYTWAHMQERLLKLYQEID